MKHCGGNIVPTELYSLAGLTLQYQDIVIYQLRSNVVFVGFWCYLVNARNKCCVKHLEDWRCRTYLQGPVLGCRHTVFHPGDQCSYNDNQNSPHDTFNVVSRQT